ncbi:hypothetical protein KM800_04870 [Clostridium tyrobutyricum]|uniref:hypothetical protein n=1 Tax=Clostridium tyrobutyricum TaxID=1519 RepID=UPI001C3859F7|nr:hypothetical protein [Clostridium tyrobutyricum]MBV4418662.1 hypothetical protein [Clostridium tyrobutyricum]
MIKRGSLVEVEKIYIENRSDVKILFRGICINDCNVGEYVDVKTMSGHLVKGVVYKDMHFSGNVHHLSKKAKEILQIKSF